MLAARLILPVDKSKWISPIVIQNRKGFDDIRVCVDFRSFNSTCVHDPFPHSAMKCFIKFRDTHSLGTNNGQAVPRQDWAYPFYLRYFTSTMYHASWPTTTTVYCLASGTLPQSLSPLADGWCPGRCLPGELRRAFLPTFLQRLLCPVGPLPHCFLGTRPLLAYLPHYAYCLLTASNHEFRVANITHCLLTWYRFLGTPQPWHEWTVSAEEGREDWAYLTSDY
jgi:hypothetical protein